MALITCRDVSLSYDGQTVLSGLSFEVSAGDYLCIVGENGSGKTTLLKALLSLKAVDSGGLFFGDGLKKKEIGYLPQQTSAQKDFPASVWEVVLSGRLNARSARPFYSGADKAAARENIRKLGIDALARRSYRELSGGQQQRVLLARALCATKKLLLLDEPVAGLDPVVTGDFYELIRKINDGGITIVMVSHDIQSAVKYASRILHLHNRPLYSGDVEGYLQSDAGKLFMGGEKNA